MMGVGFPSPASEADRRIGSPAAGCRRTATSTAMSAATKPETTQSDGHPAPYAIDNATTAAETNIPVPTPAKWIAATLPWPAAERRSSTRVEAQTITKALAMPPMHLTHRIAVVSDSNPVPAVVAALTASAISNH